MRPCLFACFKPPCLPVKMICGATLGILTCLVSQSYAADALQMKLQVNRVVTHAGDGVTYVPVTTADVGELVQYKATYTNTLNQPINNVVVTLPIPTGTVFNGQAYPIDAQASIDGKNFADIPLMHRVNGKLVKVPYFKYKTLRWNIKLLPAGKSAAVAMNTVVK